MKPLIHSMHILKLYCNYTSQIVIIGMQDFQLGPKADVFIKNAGGLIIAIVLTSD